jgi:hypothetical protein
VDRKGGFILERRRSSDAEAEVVGHGSIEQLLQHFIVVPKSLRSQYSVMCSCGDKVYRYHQLEVMARAARLTCD